MEPSTIKYSINLNFEEIQLPPIQDILILGKNIEHGKIGIMKSFELLAPNGFKYFEVNEGNVEGIMVNCRILIKIPVEQIVIILKEKVFNFVSENEMVKVDFKVSVGYSTIEHEF